MDDQKEVREKNMIEAMIRSGNGPKFVLLTGGVEHDDGPVADLQHTGTDALAMAIQGLEHGGGLVVIAFQPVYRCREGRKGLLQPLIRLKGSILGQIPGGQNQVRTGLLTTDQLQYLIQTELGIQAQQLALCIGKQMAV